MSKTRQLRRSKVKPFIKTVNYNHMMPTRYTLELEGLKGVVSNDTFKEVSQREEAKKTVKKALDERYQSGKNRWFFTPLSTFGTLVAGIQQLTQYDRILKDSCLALWMDWIDELWCDLGKQEANYRSIATVASDWHDPEPRIVRVPAQSVVRLIAGNGIMKSLDPQRASHQSSLFRVLMRSSSHCAFSPRPQYMRA